MNRAASTLKYGVPAPSAFEAVSSWRSRLALAQGCALDELLQFVDLDKRGVDLDLDMHGEALSELRRRCSLPKEAFAIAGCVMAGFHKAGLRDVYLLTDKAGSPRFRHCPMCLKQRRVACLDIQWRFVDWRYCPEHNCLMEHACWRCEAPLQYPRDIALSKAGRLGYGSQGRCRSCTADLAEATPCIVDPMSSTMITELEACWLLNGRALLAALCMGKARYRAEDVGTVAIGQRAHDEWLPDKGTWEACERRLRRSPLGRSSQETEEPATQLYVAHELSTKWGSVLDVTRLLDHCHDHPAASAADRPADTGSAGKAGSSQSG
ncbi:TniQ family protein [Paucibacter sp. O1-1]|nr:TniQ family protein [Paucibacter sp. O1-1]MDA3829881.1 TniQ family protein [Paucibacter sp. O1-1]